MLTSQLRTPVLRSVLKWRATAELFLKPNMHELLGGRKPAYCSKQGSLHFDPKPVTE